MNAETYAARRERVREKLAERGLDAMLVSSPANRFYLSGFELHDPQCNESSGMVLVTRSCGDWLLTDSRYRDAVRRIWDEDRVFIYGAPRHQSIAAFLKDLGVGPVAFEEQSFSYRFWKDMSAGVELLPVSGVVESLRVIKDADEIAAMRRSCALNHKVFAQLEACLVPGVSERELAWEIEKLYREQGASELAFATIAAVGPNGALPHAVPGEAIITANSPVLVDKGCRVDDYCSDQTRTFWVGDTPPDHFRRALDRTREAQAAGIAAIAPGRPLRSAYGAAVAVFAKYGQEAHFTHSLGHGVGLETHELPGVSSRSEGVFRPGMVVTVEPGLYYPEWGGIRWEHMVLVTDDGCEVL
ncbi:Xaa-Pro aminopeptidase [Desulfobaculum xiamenense]|uniref:Xaa-Pro aminopeptidase n=1 Tax=Desulfobaculum xiamenense TaxID=995050 RepID=A0A846QQT4_9BACT|nr:Xaa-Pro peptidase family protein [Desulfobaculum xiamenense]NJB68723.1 Xaa-Pro aminopeptidase [Desulfobaculum xiamenense]